MRYHATEDILESTGLPLERLVAAVRPDASASKLRLNQLKHLGPVSVLADGEARPHLLSHEQLRSRRDGNGEATFSVGVTGDVRREELATAEPGAGV